MWIAAAVVSDLERDQPDRFKVLVDRTGLEPGEVEQWQRAADNMYVPYDEQLGIHPQDDTFLDKEPWDFVNTPVDKYPLLLHHHPLVIYRHQVIKQAAVVLAMFLLGHEFSEEQKRRNFDFYDPLTTGDSSLSSSIQAIVAGELGYDRKALEYARYAVLMDIADVGGNVRDGLHIASMGGTWMAVIYGLGGLRDRDGRIQFYPKAPRTLGEVCFGLQIRGKWLRVCIEQDSVTYSLKDAGELTIWHEEEEIRLSAGQQVCRRKLTGQNREK
jgi:alpha,alpha-trehalose phosphorylase